MLLKTHNTKHETIFGGLAQLARALDLHSRGQEFDSPILHIDPHKKAPRLLTRINKSSLTF